MRNNLKKTIIEKGQGLTEYVLILAFIAGIAFVMFGDGSSLKGTVVKTFTKAVDTIAGLFDENYGYVTASQSYVTNFAKWRNYKSNELKKISNEERLKADREGLSLIASYFLGMTKDEVHVLMAGSDGFSNTYGSAPAWLSTNLDASRMGPGDDGWSQIMVPLSYWNADFDADFDAANGQGYYWLEASKNGNLIAEMADMSKTDAGITDVRFKDTADRKRTSTTGRVFYSDDMIGDGSSNRAVAMKVHYDDGGKVDQVWIAAQTGEKKIDKNIEGKYNMSPGYSALSGQSTSIEGLDLTVTGTSDNYKYKVNN